MLKPFDVKVYSKKMNLLLTFTDLREAYVAYENLRKSGGFLDGDLSDNTTGEIYAYFNIHSDTCGTETRTWICAELETMLDFNKVSST